MLVFPDCPGISCDRIRQRADRQPRIGSDGIHRGPTAGVLQEFRKSGFAGDERKLVDERAPSSCTQSRASPGQTMQSSRAVRRADGANTPSAKRSVKICRPHSTASQRKRRAITTSCALRPASAGRPHGAGNGCVHVATPFRMLDTS
jgi:hypothetical protein